MHIFVSFSCLFKQIVPWYNRGRNPFPMNLRKIVKAKAKKYQKVPLEMRLLLNIVLYVLVTLIIIGDGVLFLATQIKQSFKTISTFSRSLKKRLAFLHEQLLAISKTKLQMTRLALRKYSQRRALRKVEKKRLKKTKMITIFPLPFTVKLRYFIRGTVFSAVFFFLPLLIIIFIQTLPSPYELTLRQIPQTTKIFDRNGVLIDQIYASQNRTMVSLTDIPQTLQEATLAIEDKNFFHHPGFDITSIIRAFKENTTGGTFQGGSTLTQQLIKSAMLTPEPSIVRKIKEITLAFFFAVPIIFNPSIAESLSVAYSVSSCS